MNSRFRHASYLFDTESCIKADTGYFVVSTNTLQWCLCTCIHSCTAAAGESVDELQEISLAPAEPSQNDASNRNQEDEFR